MAKQDNYSKKKSEREKETILDSLVEHVIYEDKSLKILWPNETACRSVGMKREELIGRYCYEIWPKRKSPCPDCPVMESMKSGVPKEIEKTTDDGRSWYIRGYPVYNQEGEITGAVEVTLEMTEKKKAEDAIRNSEERLKAQYKGIPVPTYTWQKQGEHMVLVDYNDAAFELTHGNVKDFIGAKAAEMYRDRPQIIEDLWKCYQEKRNIEQEMLYQYQTVKETKHLEVKYAYVDPDMVLVHTFDVSERVSALLRQKVQYNIASAVATAPDLDELGATIRTELSELMDTSNFIIAFYNEQNGTLSKSYEKDTSVKNPQTWSAATSLTGMVIREGKSRIFTKKEIKELAEQGKIELIGKRAEVWAGIPLIINNKTIGAIIVQSYTDPHAYDKSSIEVLEIIAHQLSIYLEKKKIMTDLIHARNKAEESDRLKTAFLANMSHEIRTPMNGILGFASLLKNHGLSKDLRLDYLRIIEESGHRMLNIINDLIDISKIEAKQVKITHSDSNINEQLDYLYHFFKPEAENKGLQLFCRKTLPDEKAMIQSDKEKLYEVLSNLIKNAIKYTHVGTIEFGYKLIPPLIEFYVKDTGIGIAKERQDAIFDRFVQADLNLTRSYEGAGLGLSIAKAYVEMLGGEIRVESETNKGSRFSFTLPGIQADLQEEYKKKDAVEFIEESPLKIQELNVLIAEDDQMANLYLSTLLKDQCKRIYHAKTGTEAVKICRKNKDINLVLMDIKMPELDGYEATKEIRSFNKDIVIIAQTAYALSGDREKALEAGCSDYLSKPIRKEVLFSLIKKHTH